MRSLRAGIIQKAKSIMLLSPILGLQALLKLTSHYTILAGRWDHIHCHHSVIQVHFSQPLGSVASLNTLSRPVSKLVHLGPKCPTPSWPVRSRLLAAMQDHSNGFAAESW